MMNVDHLLRQTCTIYTAGAQDRFGKNTHAAGADFACRFQQTNRIIQKPNGEKAPIDGIVWLVASAAAAINDKLTFAGQDYRIMKISPMVDGSGTTRHLELMVQDWSTG
jgi:hypothetical protein